MRWLRRSICSRHWSIWPIAEARFCPGRLAAAGAGVARCQRSFRLLLSRERPDDPDGDTPVDRSQQRPARADDHRSQEGRPQLAASEPELTGDHRGQRRLAGRSGGQQAGLRHLGGAGIHLALPALHRRGTNLCIRWWATSRRRWTRRTGRSHGLRRLRRRSLSGDSDRLFARCDCSRLPGVARRRNGGTVAGVRPTATTTA